MIYNIELPKSGFSAQDYLGGGDTWLDLMIIGLVEATGMPYDKLQSEITLSELFKLNALRLSKQYAEYMNNQNK